MRVLSVVFTKVQVQPRGKPGRQREQHHTAKAWPWLAVPVNQHRPVRTHRTPASSLGAL